ncbi:MAG: T9SS type A sorting domain-containing protein, partial [Candidatus Latescibacteria bacterium]|nr:T9SS type A sorting domain-containing protein [Candidatus Latescibacterota bacterium]
DDNLFFSANAFDAGAVSFGLIGPDGTGFGYYAFSGETAGWKMGQMFLDDDTPYDGLYCDNRHLGGSPWAEGGWKANEYTSGLFFLGQDSIKGVITNAVGVANDAPAAFSVEQNAPNPFNPTTTINFTLAEAGDVAVEVYNTAGQKVATLSDGFMGAGAHSVEWDASSFSSGVYFYTVKSGGLSKTMKMTLMK